VKIGEGWRGQGRRKEKGREVQNEGEKRGMGRVWREQGERAGEKGSDGMVEDGRKGFILWGKKQLKTQFLQNFQPWGSCTTPLADQCQI